MNGFREPTREELRAIQARRERSDRISRIMGDYLLRGYRMMDSYCTHCTNILLRSRAGQDYCVACEEVDNVPGTDRDSVGSEPQPEATPDVLPSQIVAEFTDKTQQYAAAEVAISSMRKTPESAQSKAQATTSSHSLTMCQTTLDFVKESIEEKMRRSAELLKGADISESKNLLELIRDCSYTLSILAKQ